MTRPGSKLNSGVLNLQDAYGSNKAELIEGDLGTWLSQTFELPPCWPATSTSGPPPVKQRIGEWVSRLGDISVVNILYSMLKSGGLDNEGLWLVRKTFRSYRSGPDTVGHGYPRYNYNYGLSLLGPCPEENTEGSQTSEQELKHELTVLTRWSIGLPGQAEFHATH